MLNKPLPGIKYASTKQAFYYTIWGFIAGLYAFQPLLKKAQTEGKSYLAEYLEKKEKQDKLLRALQSQKLTEEQTKGPTSK